MARMKSADWGFIRIIATDFIPLMYKGAPNGAPLIGLFHQ